MSNFKEITPEEYKGNVFNDIGKKMDAYNSC